MDPTGQHAADQNPQRTRHVAELRGEDRSEQWSGGGDGGEVVTEQHVFVGLHVVVAVLQADGRRFAFGAQVHDLGGQEQAVEGDDAACRDVACGGESVT